MRGITRLNYVVPGRRNPKNVGDETVTGRTKIRSPLGRQASAWDIAYATVFMLSAESAYITAQSLVMDGGITHVG